jgi:hypothetical protein
LSFFSLNSLIYFKIGLGVKHAGQLVRRLELVARERPKILFGVGPGQLGMNWQWDERQAQEFQNGPIHYTIKY